MRIVNRLMIQYYYLGMKRLEADLLFPDAKINERRGFLLRVFTVVS